MDYEVVDNFLNVELFQKIKKLLFSGNFPWFFGNGVAHSNDPDFYFIHTFYDGRAPRSDAYDLICPIINKIEPQAILRIKANFYPRTEKLCSHNSHVDFEFPHQGAIFYINENNGPTILHDGTEIYPKENRILFFDSSKPHQSSTCTDQKARVNINFNYFKVKQNACN